MRSHGGIPQSAEVLLMPSEWCRGRVMRIHPRTYQLQPCESMRNISASQHIRCVGFDTIGLGCRAHATKGAEEAAGAVCVRLLLQQFAAGVLDRV